MYRPILARTWTVDHAFGPFAYDCVRVIFVRENSAVLFGEPGRKPISIGDVVLVHANALCGSEPEGHITVTTVYLDTDYMIDQVFWQNAGLVQDRLDARDFAKALYAEPAQVLHLGQDRVGPLMPWLDELVTISLNGAFAQYFYRMQALWFSVAHVISPYITTTTVRMPPTQRLTTRPSPPRFRRFAPVARMGSG